MLNRLVKQLKVRRKVVLILIQILKLILGNQAKVLIWCIDVQLFDSFTHKHSRVQKSESTFKLKQTTRFKVNHMYRKIFQEFFFHNLFTKPLN